MRILLVLSVFLSVNSFGCDNAAEEFYSWANLKVFPEEVSGELSSEEVARCKSKGKAYYVQLVCDSGDILMLTKWLDGKVFFQIEYLDDAKGIYGKVTTNSEGKATKYVLPKSL
ncbi:hypothetical protein [Teredinibacter waterburyi]|uniref:hypothetical protein n=1 Tax=Teredinibacter waterburyi TaxID=1500538 RepID=UPI00165F026F|nr:hypothetical protein [Teredinibacter waterburyi]